jgi:hypothetical protein
MNDLAEMIRDYIHECFDNHNYIPDDDELHEKFPEASLHLVEKQINSFFDGHYILPNTTVKWEGTIYPQVQIEMEEAK